MDTYRKARPDASAPDIYVAISSFAMMGLGSVDIAEKESKHHGAPVYLYNFGYTSEKKIPGTDYPVGTPHAMDIFLITAASYFNRYCAVDAEASNRIKQ